MRSVLGADAQAAARLHGVTEQGNWEHGNSVLERRDAGARARRARHGRPQAFAAWERSVRERLYAARARRVWPITDDKVLADWNGMALRAFAEAGRLLGRDDFVDAALQLARFLSSAMVREGNVHHAWRDGTLRNEGYLADHAQLGLGLLELHAATGEPQWLVDAHALCGRMVERFHDPAEGFTDSESAQLPMRAHDVYDGAVPSGTAAACELLLRLSGPYERTDWADIARATLDRHGALMEAGADGRACPPACALVVRTGRMTWPSRPGRAAKRCGPKRGRRSRRWSRCVHGAAESMPLLEGRVPGEAYLCRHGSCRLPARSIEALREQLALNVEIG